MVKKPSKEAEIRARVVTEDVCGAIKRNGRICMSKAGAGTDHTGVGPCKYHDHAKAIQQIPNSRNVKKSRYEGTLTRQSALDFYIELVNDPEIKSLDAEIALIRQQIGEIDEMLAEVRARHGGKLLPVTSGPKFTPQDDADHKAVLRFIDQKSKLAEQVGKLVERKVKLEEGKLVTIRQVQETLGQVVYIIKKRCEGCNVLNKLAEDFAGIDLSKFNR